MKLSIIADGIINKYYHKFTPQQYTEWMVFTAKKEKLTLDDITILTKL